MLFYPLTKHILKPVNAVCVRYVSCWVFWMRQNKWKANIISYEGPFGVGYLVADLID